MSAVEIPMTKEKETSGTWRYKADEAGGPVPLLYVRKDAFVGGALPEKIVVAIVALGPPK